jgi:SAM-dependent methyltransferase
MILPNDMTDPQEIRLQGVKDYYSDKVRRFGATPQGVDWRDSDSQNRRFDQLRAILAGDPAASVADVGCGYGAFATFLRHHGWIGRYEGIDVAPEMIEGARKHLTDTYENILTVGTVPVLKADYVVASGIFNVKLDETPDQWLPYIYRTIDLMVDKASKGIAFNCLTAWSDADKMQDHLFYAVPEHIFTYCAQRHTRWIELSQDYDLFEFTLRLRFDRRWPNLRRESGAASTVTPSVGADL